MTERKPDDLRRRLALVIARDCCEGTLIASFDDLEDAGVEGEWLRTADEVIREIFGPEICECGEPLDFFTHADLADVQILHGKYAHTFKPRNSCLTESEQ